MAQLPELTKINLEDVDQEQRGWFGKIAETVNKFISSVGFAINGRLELEKNVQAQVKVLEFTQSATVYPLKFRCTLPVRPSLVIKGALRDISTIPAAITSAADIDWELNASGELQINNVTGLTSARKYRLTLIIF